MKEELATAHHQVGTREEWLKARLELLAAEKEHTRRGDELAVMRRELPWVRVEKEYVFETEGGKASLADLFQGRSQLLVYHFMFGPDYKVGCPSCSSIADGFNDVHVHLANHDVMLWAVSRGPFAKLQEYKRRMGWTFPWASAAGSDFNADYNVGFSAEEQQRNGGIEYNFRREDAWKPARGSNLRHRAVDSENVFGTGVDWPTYLRERPGVSAFASKTGLSTIPILPMPAGWMRCGACGSGLTALRWAATRHTRGGDAATSTTAAARVDGKILLPRLSIAANCA